MLKLKSDTIWSTAEEDACIREGIAADPDARELANDEYLNMHLTSEIHPELVRQYLKSKGRGKQNMSIKAKAVHSQ